MYEICQTLSWKISEVENVVIHETKSHKFRSCEIDLCSLELSEQNPNIIIGRIFNTFPVHMKLIEDPKEFITKVHTIVLHHQFYDMDELFSFLFDLDLNQL